VELRSSGAGATLHTDIANVLPRELGLFEPCDAEHEFTVEIDSSSGLPESAAFTFTGTGDYELSLQLTAKDYPIEPAITVIGTVVRTRSPRILFVPISLDATPAKGAPPKLRILEDYVRDLAAKSKEHIPDYWPLRAGSLDVHTYDGVEFVGDALREQQGSLAGWVKKLQNAKNDILGKDKYEYEKSQARDALEYISAELLRRLSLQSALTGGQRIVAVMRQDQYTAVDPAHGAPDTGSGGIAPGPKVVFFPDIDDPPDTEVAHELTHTLPYLWSSDEMQEECAVDFHNTDAVNAAGFQLMSGMSEVRRLQDAKKSLMSSNQRKGQWIDQCTYRHLVDVLQNPPDPRVLIVQGLLQQAGDTLNAQLMPLYQTDGAVDLRDDAPLTGYAIVLRDGDGLELGRYPFDPHWKLEGAADAERSVVSFSYRVPDLAGIAAVQIEGPDGVVADQAVAAKAPALRIDAPNDGARVNADATTLPVRWTAPKGALASVLTSTDNGRSWNAVAVERALTHIDVRLPAAQRRLVKVIVTDGGRSAERIVHIEPKSKAGFPVLLLVGGVAVVALVAGVALRRRRAVKE
jgi:hypothetical protein